MSSASIFRRLTNQPAIPDRRACAKQEDILLIQDTTIWRTTGLVRIDFRPVLIYMCAPRARGLAPSRVFLLYRADNRLPTPPRLAPFWVSAEVLAGRTSFSFLKVSLIKQELEPARIIYTFWYS
jgi:hypothetical protein